MFIITVALAGMILVDVEASGSDSVAFEPALPQPEITQKPAPPQEQVPDLLETILARPLFTQSRHPPDTTSSKGPADTGLADVRLTGILVEPHLRLAIFAVSGAKPLTLSEGEALNGWRLDSISPQEVLLSGPGGARTLELKADSKLVRQARVPAARPKPPQAAPPGPAGTGAAGQPVAARAGTSGQPVPARTGATGQPVAARAGATGQPVPANSQSPPAPPSPSAPQRPRRKAHDE
jgi:hypothetical protein